MKLKVPLYCNKKNPTDQKTCKQFKPNEHGVCDKMVCECICTDKVLTREFIKMLNKRNETDKKGYDHGKDYHRPKRPTFDQIGRMLDEKDKETIKAVDEFLYYEGFSVTSLKLDAYKSYLGRKRITEISDYAQGNIR